MEFFHRRFIKTLIYSWQGIKICWQKQEAFRLEVLVLSPITLIMLTLCQSIGISLWLIASWLWVLTAELINSAIEAVVDRISLEKHELSAEAKDIGSAVVLISLIQFAVSCTFIIWQFLG